MKWPRKAFVPLLLVGAALLFAYGSLKTGHPFFGCGWPLISIAAIVVIWREVPRASPTSSSPPTADSDRPGATNHQPTEPRWVFPLFAIALIATLMWCGIAALMSSELSW